MAKRKYDDKMKLDMPFGEALARFAGTNPDEMHANIKRAKKKKPPGGKNHKPSGDAVAQNIVSLRDEGFGNETTVADLRRRERFRQCPHTCWSFPSRMR
jgi:hypothetical protein